MDIMKLLEDLKAERHMIEEAIIVLERISTGQGRRRGRKPAWMTEREQGDGLPKRRGRPRGSKNKPKVDQV